MEKRIGIAYIVTTILAFVATVALQREAIAPEHRYLIPPPEMIEYFTFGFSESIADSLWLRWIQDSDTCQTYAGVGPAHPAEPRTGEFANPRKRFCDNSWSFKMLDATTRLAPRFKTPYEAGPITLAVATEDYEGATVIFDRGIKMYPNDWQLLYQAAYHQLFDLGNYTKAADLMLVAARNGAPAWLNILAARLYSKAGQIELGMRTLLKFRETVTDNPEALARVDQRIKELQAQMSEPPQKGP